MFNSYKYQDIYKNLGINTNDLGCVMLEILGFENCKNAIDENDLFFSKEYTWVKGFVAHPGHLTLLYGLLNFNKDLGDHIRTVLKDWQLEKLEIDSFDKFESQGKEDYYCVIAKLKLTDNLYEAHKRISLLPHINTFPDYTPHVTIAYIKKDDTVLDQVLKNLNSHKYNMMPIEIWADNNTKSKIPIAILQKT